MFKPLEQIVNDESVSYGDIILVRRIYLDSDQNQHINIKPYFYGKPTTITESDEDGDGLTYSGIYVYNSVERNRLRYESSNYKFPSEDRYLGLFFRFDSNPRYQYQLIMGSEESPYNLSE